MDDEDRRLFERSLRRACESTSGAAPRPCPRRARVARRHWRSTPPWPCRPCSRCRGRSTSARRRSMPWSARPWDWTPARRPVWSCPRSATGRRRAGWSGGISPSAAWRRRHWAIAATALVVTRSGHDHLAVEVATADLTLRSVQGMDPRLGLVEVTGDDIPVTTRRDLAPGDWPRAIALARLAVGHELVGASRAMLELARGARPGTDPVRPAHRRLPGRPPPAGRHPGGRRVGRRDAGLGLGRGVAAGRSGGQGPGRSQRPDGCPSLPAGAGRHRVHRPSTRSTTTSAASCCSTSCSAPPVPSPATWAESCWPPGELPNPPPL